MHRFYLFIALTLSYWSSLAQAQDAWKAEWDGTIARAREQGLSLSVHTENGYEQLLDEFKRDFPGINVRVTIAAAQPTAVRILTEQKNGIYEWDSWWAPIANMVSILLPANALAPIDDFLILPEVKTAFNWNAASFLRPGQPSGFIFVHTYQQDRSIYQNVGLRNDQPIFQASDMLDPRFKNRIAMREPSGLNSTTLALSGLLRENDIGLINRLFMEIEPTIIENPRQLINTLESGDHAAVIGASTEIITQCVKAGGCTNLRSVPIGVYVTSRGVSVLKNPPHPDAVKVWINWLLSKRGQEAFVQTWAKYNSAGATSMRKDVAPAPGHEASLPNFDTLGRYTLAADSSGRDFTDQIVRAYSDYKDRKR